MEAKVYRLGSQAIEHELRHHNRELNAIIEDMRGREAVLKAKLEVAEAYAFFVSMVICAIVSVAILRWVF